ncbi:MAG: flagellar protein [Lachnospiraceae bacterium]|nr:flagellar protein [Lachnospiraceae bacterium]
MDIRNCPNCGNMFQYVGSRICPNCVKKLDEDLQKVKAYLDENKGATVAKVSEECDVSVKQIRRWIKEERLMFAPGVDTGLVCMQCGMPIASGTLCDKCAAQMKDGFDASVNRNNPKPQPSKPKSSDSSLHLSKYK